ncbi:MAG TPA: recombinase family protein [Solirubrobacteraceae bacterium]|jgi:DNA invertase Pin-like site-specific DNA recombinase|nr:recombinase family protein [Solirubrobacteraceae bacterium]
MQLDEYRRVSQVAGREGDKFLSPELQAKGIAAYAQAHGHTVRPNPEELDVSGSKLRRPVLDAIMARIRNGESDGIIVNDLDRYSRDVLGGNLLLVEIKEAGGTLVSVHENLDITTPDGKMMFDFRMAIAENVIARTREKWAEAQRHAVEKGVYTEPYVPAGYEKGEDRRLRLNADAPIIKQAFRMRAAREPTVRIVDFLNDRLPRPEGGLWIAPTVERIFSRRIYVGELSRRGVTNTQACEPLVTETEWQAAQITRKKSSPRTKSDHLLVGIIRCAGCRYLMTPNAGLVKKRGKVYRIPNYRCRRLHGAGRCPSPSTITRKSIDEYVEAAFRAEMAGTVMAAASSSADIERTQDHLHKLEAEPAGMATRIRLTAVVRKRPCSCCSSGGLALRCLTPMRVICGCPPYTWLDPFPASMHMTPSFGRDVDSKEIGRSGYRVCVDHAVPCVLGAYEPSCVCTERELTRRMALS